MDFGSNSSHLDNAWSSPSGIIYLKSVESLLWWLPLHLSWVFILFHRCNLKFLWRSVQWPPRKAPSTAAHHSGALDAKRPDLKPASTVISGHHHARPGAFFNGCRFLARGTLAEGGVCWSDHPNGDSDDGGVYHCAGIQAATALPPSRCAPLPVPRAAQLACYWLSNRTQSPLGLLPKGKTTSWFFQSPHCGLAVLTHGNQKDPCLSKLYIVGFAINY